MPIIEHIVPTLAEPERLDVYLLDALPHIASKSQARKLARRGALRVNGEEVRGTDRLHSGDHVSIVFPDTSPHPVLEWEIAVIYEDEWLAVIDKPPGLATSGNRRLTVVNALPHNIQPSSEPDALVRPHPVHRLDARTGGLLVIAKTARANVALGHAFQARQVSKRYRALLVGRLDGEGLVEEPLDDRPAQTRYRTVLHTSSTLQGAISTVDLWPLTGRTHQLRRHMAGLGHPVVGEDLYRGELPNIRRKGLYLRSVELTLKHPITEEPLHVRIPEPERFQARRDKEQRRWEWHTREQAPTDPQSH